MDEERYQSQLFTLRLWWEELGEDETQWRGQLLHVTSGQVRHFSDWSTLIPLLFALLPPTRTAQLVNPPGIDSRKEG